MKQEIINSNYEKRLASMQEPHKGVISRKGTMLQSQTGEELVALLTGGVIQ